VIPVCGAGQRRHQHRPEDDQVAGGDVVADAAFALAALQQAVQAVVQLGLHGLGLGAGDGWSTAEWQHELVALVDHLVPPPAQTGQSSLVAGFGRVGNADEEPEGTRARRLIASVTGSIPGCDLPDRWSLRVRPRPQWAILACKAVYWPTQWLAYYAVVQEEGRCGWVWRCPNWVATAAQTRSPRLLAPANSSARVLAPVTPSDLHPGGGSPQQPYPPEFRSVLDPVVVLAAAAASTTTMWLGSSTLVAPWHNALLLARSLTSLDLLLGGSSPVAMARIGRRAAGWLPVQGMDPRVMAQLWHTARHAAEQAGRDPDLLRRELRINVHPGQGARHAAEAVAQARDSGIEGAFLDLQYATSSVDESLSMAADVIAKIGLR
jgi:hypothetical protein